MSGRRESDGLGSRSLRTLGAALALLGAVIGLASPAAAQPAGDPDADDPGYVAVLEVSGLIDPVLADFLETEIGRAERGRAVALVLQLNSGDAVLSDREFADLTDRIDEATIPVAIWVGPSGSKAGGDTLALLEVADVVAVAPGSSIRLPDGTRLSSQRALDEGVADLGQEQAATILSTIGELRTFGIPVETRIVGTGDERTREPVTQVRFGQLPLTSQLLHTVSSTAVAYLLFVIGLALLVFELFTAGVGVAGIVGAGCVLLGSYGLATLPTRPLAVGLLLVSMFAYAVDVQTGVPRLWTGIATVAFVIGSLTLYDGLSVSWITLVVTFIGMTLAMLAGMPAMVRARFSTPTIGRDWMIGELGEALADVAPDGVVSVREAPWRARTNRATPIRRGDRVRVIAIEGLVLEVEPEEGAARDYRERSKSH